MPSKQKAGDDDQVKTTLRLPERLWKAARILALDDRCDFQDIVAKALEAYLAKRGRV